MIYMLLMRTILYNTKPGAQAIVQACLLTNHDLHAKILLCNILNSNIIHDHS